MFGVSETLAAQPQAIPVAYQVPYVKASEQHVYFQLCILILRSYLGLREEQETCNSKDTISATLIRNNANAL